jgi:hypothetical protein
VRSARSALSALACSSLRGGDVVTERSSLNSRRLASTAQARAVWAKLSLDLDRSLQSLMIEAVNDFALAAPTRDALAEAKQRGVILGNPKRSFPEPAKGLAVACAPI